MIGMTMLLWFKGLIGTKTFRTRYRTKRRRSPEHGPLRPLQPDLPSGVSFWYVRFFIRSLCILCILTLLGVHKDYVIVRCAIPLPFPAAYAAGQANGPLGLEPVFVTKREKFVTKAGPKHARSERASWRCGR